MVAFSRFVTRFLVRRGVTQDRLRRFCTADLARSTDSFEWTAAELRMMAEAEKLSRVTRYVAQGAL